jgi:lysophospholipase L1-like esterase
LSNAASRKVKVTNPAVGGFTTLNLIAKELSLVRRTRPDLITILIGVNDLVQGRTPTDYRGSLVTIYDEVKAQKPQDGRVFAISLPNWSVVPAARQFGDPEEIRDLTDTFNDIARGEAEARGFKWIDITAASLSGLGSPDWIASDGLHPADRQYAAWAEVIWFSVRDAFPSPAPAGEGRG